MGTPTDSQPVCGHQPPISKNPFFQPYLILSGHKKKVLKTQKNITTCIQTCKHPKAGKNIQPIKK